MVIDLLMAVFGGGATGLLGTLLSKGFGIWEKKQDYQFILEKHKLDAELRSKEMEHESAVQELNAESNIRIASYDHDRVDYTAVSKWVANVRALVRPILTLSQIIMLVLLWLTNGLSEDQKMQIVQAVVYLNVTTGTWWFGARDKK